MTSSQLEQPRICADQMDDPVQVRAFLTKGGDPGMVFKGHECNKRTADRVAKPICPCLASEDRWERRYEAGGFQFLDVKDMTMGSLGKDVTLLHVVAFFKNEECIKMLLQAGGPALLEKKTSKGFTPLDTAVLRNAKPSIIALLQGDGLGAPRQMDAMMTRDHGAVTTIMISYQWDSQPLAFKIRDALEKVGKTVIIDTGGISGNFLEWMAESVQKSDCIILVLSQKYEMSKNCEKEACRAHDLQKRLIPVVAEKGYKGGEGWLALIIAGLLRYDAYDDDSFDSSMERILEREV